jgi:hypothetical protein
MAAGEALRRAHGSAERPVPVNRLFSVLGTAGEKSTASGEKRRNQLLVRAEKNDECPTQYDHNELISR